MKPFVFIIILLICIAMLAGVLWMRNLLDITDTDIPKIEITQGQDNTKNINICVNRSLIKKDIAPIVIKEFLSQTKITSLDNGGLELTDFKGDSMLAKYGFKKGDVVKEINGQRVNTTKEAIKICDALEEEVLGSRDGKDIGVVLDRGGENIYMNYRVPEFVPEKVQYTMHLQKRARR